MSQLRVESFTISLDGFGAGPHQSIDQPLGVGGTALHGWAFATRTFQKAVFGDESWRGWWGENPVYQVPVFVLTHHARAPLVMEGGTTFHFVTDGIASALAQARAAAGSKDVRLGGGVQTIQQYLRERLVDEMHIAIAPVLLGSGERLFDGVDLPALGYACTQHVASPLATHVVFTRK